MRTACAIPLLTLAVSLLTGCSAADRLVHSRLSELAGPGALDCGKGQTMERLPRVNACAIESERQNRPFFVRYLTHGDDSLVTVGIARNMKGELFKVVIDHYPNGGHADPTFEAKGQLVTLKCRGTKIALNRGMMTCDP